MNTGQPAALAVEGGDPRVSMSQDKRDNLDGADVVAHDAARAEYTETGRLVSFEEYVYFAGLSRILEKENNERYIESQGSVDFRKVLKKRFSTGAQSEQSHVPELDRKGAFVVSGVPEDALVRNGSPGETVGEIEKTGEPTPGPGGVLVPSKYGITDAERYHASRAMRTTSWGTIFYLITTDILGPTAIPWAFAQMGYGPGVALFTVFGGLSFYAGWILYKCFMDLDSDRYPLRGYGDYFFRVFGPWSRHFVNIMQAIQQLLTVSTLMLSNGQGISQISQGPSGVGGICFIACLIIFMACGFVLGQIRTLQRFAWLANFSVYSTVVVICMCLGTAANDPPNKAAIFKAYPFIQDLPITKYAGTPPPGMATGGSGFIGSLNGLSQAVYAYAGALLFAAFMAEMRHPADFWKGLLIAETFIYCVYIFFGIFVYSFHGQYTFNPIQQGIVLYNYQTAANVLLLLSGLVAAALYGNIGLKVVYVEVFQELLGFPKLTDRAGKFWWAAFVPVYWAVAFIVCAAIPQFSFVSGLIGAVFLLTFTYTFPAVLSVGFNIRMDAMDESVERFDPVTRTYNYRDTGFRRYARGYMKKPIFNTWNVIFTLGALATTGLGTYAAVKGLISSFADGASTSFTCVSPV